MVRVNVVGLPGDPERYAPLALAANQGGAHSLAVGRAIGAARQLAVRSSSE